ncbi:hypothetical protein FH610_035900 [Microbispora catharanthi]|uniref:Platelet-activating factor acetylhydrolase n=2 Tax=Microbispora catharanthi TaxID=1712871 RepID=A0A5N6BFQ4_9ACTN|nr:hypothetical protein FH610_035900 [Microbispora catharanthi]
MSPLEILLLLGVVGLLSSRWCPPRARRPVALAAAAVVAVSGIVLTVRGLRWQMAPALAGVLVALAFAVPVLAGRPARRVRRWLALPGVVVCIGLVCASATAAWAVPVPVFPGPSGPYAVGTAVMQWTDVSRPEPATDEPGDHRTVVVQLWYPAPKGTAGPRARYLGRTEREARTVADGLTGYIGVPAFLLDDAVRARTGAVYDAPAAAGRFPIVLFSPGLGGVRTQNTAWAEELAGRGYVVAALDHPYDSAAVVLDDGRTIRTRVVATGDDEEDRRLATGWTAVRAADLSFVLTQLGRLDRGEIRGPLTGRLDTARAAATGHSMGGGAALRAARQDSRFAAVIDLDGYPYDPAPGSYHQPVLALTHPVDPADNPSYIPRLTRILSLSTSESYRITVPGAAHLTFADAPLYMPPVPSVVGSLGRTGGLTVTTAATMAFLDATLRDKPGDLATLLRPYGDLTVHRPVRKDDTGNRDADDGHDGLDRVRAGRPAPGS